MREDQSLTKDFAPEKEEIPVRLPKPISRGARAFVTLLFCGALFVAAFGLGLLLEARGQVPAFLSDWLKQEAPSDSKTPTETPAQELPGETNETQTKTEDEQVGEKTTAPLPEGAIAVVKKDLAGGEVLQNLSVYSVDPEALTRPAPETASGKGPLVLILCTHSSECYSDGVSVLSPIGDAIYSTDPDAGVLAVGKALAESLSQKGVPSLFCNVRHDEPTLRGSYARAKESIETLLKEYPSIKYIIDLHRDGIVSEDAIVASSVEWEGESYAQILPVVGSDGDGSEVYPWKENLALALEMEKRLNELCPQLCRPVSLRNSPYNQNLAEHALLLEIGAAGNTKEEALRSAELLARGIAGYFKGE